MDTVIGTCSRCGGPVMHHTGPWFGIPPVPYCGHCGAQKAYGPVIEMGPPQKSVTTSTITVYGRSNMTETGGS